MIGKKMADALNAQIGREYSASIEYLAMGAWFEGKGLEGFAKLFYQQAAEENGHGLKIVKYLGEVGGRVSIPAIAKPRDAHDSVVAALERFLAMEEEVTRAIHDLVQLANAEKDHSAFQFLQWYVEEQREEVSSATMLLEKARRFGEERVVILDGMLGRE
jgi:ferritin